MFITDTFIDSFQEAKKKAVAAMVKDQTLATALNSIIDAQAVYTKQFVNTLGEAAKTLGSVATQDAAKFNMFKAYQK
jgi:hypothetical protein